MEEYLIPKEILIKLILMAHDSITKHKKEYAPDVHEIQAWIDNYLKNNHD